MKRIGLAVNTVLLVASILIGWTGSAVGAPAVQAASVTPDLTARLLAMEQALEAKRRELGVPGLSLVVVRDGQVIFRKGFGRRSLEADLPVTPETLFPIGSSAKAFTGALVAMSVDDGKLSLDDHPRKHLPYFRLQDEKADKAITVRDLLIHNSGLARTELLWIPGVLTREELIRALADAKPTAPFGERYQYQNVLYAAAGEAAAKAQGSTWERLTRDRILRPLGMSKTVLQGRDMVSRPNHAVGYHVDAKTKAAKPRPLAPRNSAMESVAPAGAIFSSANDMAKWLSFMLAGGKHEGRQLISEPMFKAITAPQFENLNGATLDYGLGWFLLERGGKQVLQHGGSFFGYRAQVSLMPEEKLGFVLMANADTPLVAGDVGGGIGEEIIWSSLLGPDQKLSAPAAPAAAAAPSAPVEPAVLGSYRAEVRGRTLSFDLANKDGTLIVNRPGQPPLVLADRGKDTFGIVGASEAYQVRVLRDAQGAVSGLLFKQPNADVELARVEPYDAPISVDELMQRAIAAAGGEAALRKHRTRRTEFDINFANQGIKGQGWIALKAPGARTTDIVLTAQGKQLGWTREWFDGEKGGQQLSFMPAEETFGPEEIARQRLSADLDGPLGWSKQYKSIAIEGETKVGEEDAFIVVKTPAMGAPVRDYISKSTYLVLRRDGGAGVTTYADYKPVGGVMLPHRWITSTPSTGEQIIEVKAITHDAPLEQSTFAPR